MVILIGKRGVFPGIYRVSLKSVFFDASLQPSFVTKSVRLNRTELLFFSRVANREI